MKMNKKILAFCLVAMTVTTLTGCFSSKSTSSSGRGGEVVGVGGGRSFREPAPYGMTLVKRGWLKMGIEKQSVGKEHSGEGHLSGRVLDGRHGSYQFRIQAVCVLGARLYPPHSLGRSVIRWRRDVYHHRGQERRPRETASELEETATAQA